MGVPLKVLLGGGGGTLLAARDKDRVRLGRTRSLPLWDCGQGPGQAAPRVRAGARGGLGVLGRLTRLCSAWNSRKLLNSVCLRSPQRTCTRNTYGSA